MKEETRQALAKILTTHGQHIAQDPRLCHAFLRDYRPLDDDGIKLLVNAAKARMPDTLAQSAGKESISVTNQRLAQQLQSQHGHDTADAFWAIETWSVALKLMPASAARPSPAPPSLPIQHQPPSRPIPPQAPARPSNITHQPSPFLKPQPAAPPPQPPSKPAAPTLGPGVHIIPGPQYGGVNPAPPIATPTTPRAGSAPIPTPAYAPPIPATPAYQTHPVLGRTAQSLFSFAGRISPAQFLWVAVPTGAIYPWITAMAYAFAKSFPPMMMVLFMPLLLGMIPVTWVFMAAAAKRWHDMDITGWRAALIFTPPVVGHLFTLVIGGLIQGTRGPNRFGPQPLI